MKKKLKKLCFFIAILIVFNLSAEKTIYVEGGHMGESAFDLNPFIGNSQTSCRHLKTFLESIDYKLIQVPSIDNLNNPEYIFIFDLSFIDCASLSAYPKEKCVLFLWEPPSVSPKNYDRSLHNYFSVIFTWDDSLVDNIRYFHFYNPQPVLKMIDPVVDFYDKKFSTLIAGNKHSSDARELYTERVKIIEYFEEIETNDFDFYGIWWDSCNYKNYKGAINKKIDYLKQYKFCICYENMTGINGYVTEKIFDCFIAGCVPIYWGADNINDYIPSNCFIDRRVFNSNQELYDYLKTISKDEYESYLTNIRTYLLTPQGEAFSSNSFIKTIIKTLSLN